MFFVVAAFILAVQNNSFTWVILYVAFAFSLSIASFFTYRKTGDTLLMGIYAIIQLPFFVCDGLKYQLNNGVLLTVGIKAPSNLDVVFESYTIKFGFSLHSQDDTIIYANIVSVITLFYLLFLNNRQVNNSPICSNGSITSPLK